MWIHSNIFIKQEVVNVKGTAEQCLSTSSVFLTRNFQKILSDFKTKILISRNSFRYKHHMHSSKPCMSKKIINVISSLISSDIPFSVRANWVFLLRTLKFWLRVIPAHSSLLSRYHNYNMKLASETACHASTSKSINTFLVSECVKQSLWSFFFILDIL